LLKSVAGNAQEQGTTQSVRAGNARSGTTGGLGGSGSPDLSSLLGSLAGNAGTGATGGGPGGLGSPDLGSMLGGAPDASILNQMLQNPAMMQMMQNIMSDPQTMNQVQYVLTQANLFLYDYLILNIVFL
jgi:ubiquilin